MYETSTDEDASSKSDGPVTDLVQFHLEITQIDICDYVKLMIKKFDHYVDSRMKRLHDEIWEELDKGSDSGKWYVAPRPVYVM